MSLSEWERVDRYICDTLVGEDEVLERALERARKAGLPPIQVTPPQGKLLHLLVASVAARQVLEIGTLGGYSTIWMARALAPEGRLVSLEIDSLHARVARANVDDAGLGNVVEILEGPALESLEGLAREGAGPFDFVFIDADKPNCPEYFSWSMRLGRVGTLIVVDNVVREGTVADPMDDHPDAVGVRRMNELIAKEPRVQATAIQTVGTKGHDGFLLALVVS
jgi:predicted O-methyltransferase YrrM